MKRVLEYITESYASYDNMFYMRGITRRSAIDYQTSLLDNVDYDMDEFSVKEVKACSDALYELFEWI